MSAITVHHGDSAEVLKGLADASIDSVVCDPPYGLSFMGKAWDYDVPGIELWREVYRVLKPGAHLVAFFGTRTYHRGAVAMEDAGFEIRDMVSWLYGSGFPKSLDVSKAIDKAKGAKRPIIGRAKGAGSSNTDSLGVFQGEYDRTVAATKAAGQWEGWGTALKPALEPIVLARKPLIGTVAANVQQHGTGALNIDGCRVDGEPVQAVFSGAKGSKREAIGGASVYGDSEKYQSTPHAAGRWPANVVHDGSDEVVDGFPAESGGGNKRLDVKPGVRPGGFGNVGADKGTNVPNGALYGDSGSAARFFYTAKADADDRLGSKHPTVKPIDLMAYLCRLVTPPGGVILDPFAGTGTTGIAAMREGFDCILIEREADYVADIERRLAWARGEGRLTAQEKARNVNEDKAAGADLPLFGRAAE